MGPTGESVFSSPPPHIFNENRLPWDLSPKQFQQMTDELIAKTRKVYDVVGSIELDSVTFDNTLKALANMQAEYFVQRNIVIFLKLQACPRTTREEACKKLLEFDEDMRMRKDIYQRIVALGMKVDEDSLTTEEKRYVEILLGESIKEIQDKMKSMEVDAHRPTTEAYIDTYMETNMEARRRALHLPKEKRNEIKCINNMVRRTNVLNVRCQTLVKLRAQKSDLLGFKTYADFALQKSMAKSANTVSMFLDELAHNTIPNLWSTTGIPYYVSLREYFPVDVVTQGLLDICQDLLGLSFSLVHGTPVWHPDVTLYSVTDSSSGQIVGQFYLDLFKRKEKYAPWGIYPLQPSCLLPDGSRQIAVAVCVTDFDRYTTDSHYLLTHKDVMEYFHELGHVMHIVCAQTDYAIFSPFVEWYSDYQWDLDFSEVPSQMLENWVWEKEPLQRISKHYKTGAPIPDDLLDKLIKSRHTVHSGPSKHNKIFSAKFGLALYTQTGLVDPPEVVYERLRTEILKDPGYNTADIPSLEDIDNNDISLDPHRYLYLWGEVFAVDMFHTRFKQEGIMNAKVGLEYRNCILKPGCSKDAYEMLKNFLGREPNTEAFLLSQNVKCHIVEDPAFVKESHSDDEWDYIEPPSQALQNMFLEKVEKRKNKQKKQKQKKSS